LPPGGGGGGAELESHQAKTKQRSLRVNSNVQAHTRETSQKVSL